MTRRAVDSTLDAAWRARAAVLELLTTSAAPD
jgi:hypothetical protein